MLNDPETATVPMRYFQGRRTITRGSRVADIDTPEGFPESRPAGPMPARITERVLFTPDSSTYCCESTPSLWVEVLGYDAEWDSADEEVSDALREWWDTALSDCHSNDDDYYVHYHKVVASYEKDGPVTFAGWFTTVHEDGEFESHEDAREYAQGNWHV